MDQSQATTLAMQPLITVERYGSSSSERAENLLIHGDNLQVMEALLPDYEGKIDLIYIDPPFDVGSDFRVSLPVGGRKKNSGKNNKIVEMVAFRDRWEEGGYLQMLRERLQLMHRLLSERGSIYVHVDYRVSAEVRLLLDEVFTRDSFINEIIWFYKTGGVPEKIGFGKKHDTIFFYAKNPAKATWNRVKEKSYLSHRYGFSNIKIEEDESGVYTMVNCRDVWDIPALRGNQPERVDYPTQKPEAVLERIISASSNPGDLVADFFCGSGTTGAVANSLGRRWLLSDQSPLAIHTAKKRLLGQEGVSFEIGKLNFGDSVENADRSDITARIVKHVKEGGLEIEGELKGADSSIERVDLWGVRVGSIVRWCSFRTRQAGELKIRSERIAVGKGGEEIEVVAFDVGGREIAVRVEG